MADDTVAIMEESDQSNDSLVEIIKKLEENPEIRKAAIAHLAKEFPEDFLAKVSISTENLGTGGLNLAPVSDKEWQE